MTIKLFPGTPIIKDKHVINAEKLRNIGSNIAELFDIFDSFIVNVFSFEIVFLNNDEKGK